MYTYQNITELLITARRPYSGYDLINWIWSNQEKKMCRIKLPKSNKNCKIVWSAKNNFAKKNAMNSIVVVLLI
jgi:hypothetical protein